MLRRAILSLEALIILTTIILVAGLVAAKMITMSSVLERKASETTATIIPEKRISAAIIYDKESPFAYLQRVLMASKIDVRAIPVDQISFSDLIQYDVILCVADISKYPHALSTMQTLLEQNKEAILFYHCVYGLQTYVAANTQTEENIPPSRRVTVEVSDQCVGFCEGLTNTFFVPIEPVSYIRTTCSHPSFISFKYEDPLNPGTYITSDLLCVSQKRAFISVNPEEALKEGWPGFDRLIINTIIQLTST